jgi:hypothetical protein
VPGGTSSARGGGGKADGLQQGIQGDAKPSAWQTCRPRQGEKRVRAALWKTKFGQLAIQLNRGLAELA